MEPQRHRLALQQDQEKHEHATCAIWLAQTVHPEINCALDSLIWISTSLAYLELPSFLGLAWAPKSLRLQNPSPTSLLPKHKAGVILHSPHKSVPQMMEQKNRARGERERDPLLFPSCQEHEESTGAGLTQCPLLSLCTYKASDRPRAWWSLLGRTCSVSQRQILQFLYKMEMTNFGPD